MSLSSLPCLLLVGFQLLGWERVEEGSLPSLGQGAASLNVSPLCSRNHVPYEGSSLVLGERSFVLGPCHPLGSHQRLDQPEVFSEETVIPSSKGLQGRGVGEQSLCMSLLREVVYLRPGSSSALAIPSCFLLLI